MRGRSAQRLEDMLRTGAGRARRDPSPVLRSKVRAAIEAAGSEVDRESTAGPFARSASRERRRVVSIAAAILVALGLGVFGFLQSGGEGVSPALLSDRTASNSIASAPEPFVRLALAGQRTLRTAVDDPLITELEGIAQDATRTFRFLAGRVPASQVARENEGPGR